MGTCRKDHLTEADEGYRTTGRRSASGIARRYPAADAATRTMSVDGVAMVRLLGPQLIGWASTPKLVSSMSRAHTRNPWCTIFRNSAAHGWRKPSSTGSRSRSTKRGSIVHLNGSCIWAPRPRRSSSSLSRRGCGSRPSSKTDGVSSASLTASQGIKALERAFVNALNEINGYRQIAQIYETCKLLILSGRSRVSKLTHCERATDGRWPTV